MQLNVSYNFKRLALKNDFHIRQYMIENGMNLMKDDENGMETSLEIHQIHNVIRTSNRRSLIAPPPPPPTQSISAPIMNELRRNSTTSSVSGVSTMILNGCDTMASASNADSNGNVNVKTPKPFNVRPIQIKLEPIDPDYEDTTTLTNGKQSQTVQSSPSNSSGSLSILTVNSSSGASSVSRMKSPPMIVINGLLNGDNNDKNITKKKSVTKISTVTERSPTRNANRKRENLPPSKSLRKRDEEMKNRDEKSRNLRTIRKTVRDSKKKLREAVKKTMENAQKAKAEKKKVQQKSQGKQNKNIKKKPVTKPPKNKGAKGGRGYQRKS